MARLILFRRKMNERCTSTSTARSMLVGVAIATVFTGNAAGHAFVQPYSLPVPFTYYVYGATIALIASFVVVGLFASDRVANAGLTVVSDRGASGETEEAHSTTCATVGLLLLALTIATGLAGTRNPYVNFNMTFFWIVFVLGVPYAVAIVGDFYALFNPWRAVVAMLEVALGRPFGGLVSRPDRFGYYPGLILYVAFIWLELFGQLSPRGLSVALLVYTVMNVAGSVWLGTAYWFRHCEFFAVMLRLLGLMSIRPAGWAVRSNQRAWSWPFIGLLSARAERGGLTLFVLFMLSSTAFDGIHGTLVFTRFFFGEVYPLLEPSLSGTEAQKFAKSATLFYAWQWISLAASPVLYLFVLGVFAWMTKVVTGTTLAVKTLVRRFTLSLIPIAFVYHITHYYTLLLSQGPQLWKIASDPFGFRWDLFGTASQTVAPIMVSAGAIWMSQVVLIVLGHIVGVYVAHIEALRMFPVRRTALVSQLPMLFLMVLFTGFGLWILSLPLA